MKKTYQIEGIISILLGLILIFIPTNIVLSILQLILGICLIMFYLPTTILSITANNMKYVGIKSLIFTILGFVIIIFGFNIIGTVIGIIMLIFLLLDLINSSNKKEILKKDLVKYIIAIILIFVGVNKVIDVIILIAGILLIIGGIIKLVIDAKVNNNEPKRKDNHSYNEINENVIDAKFEKHEE